jgi:hypothetical protein
MDKIGFGDAMDSPLLFEPFFRAPSWSLWRAVVRAAFAEPMTADQIAEFRTVAERDPPTAPVSELILPIGRGGGKDSIASFLLAVIAMNFDPKGILRPGEKATVGCFACDRPQAQIILDYTRGYFEEIPALAALVVNPGKITDCIELKNRVVISVSTASYRSVRGRRFIACVMDEVAFFRSEESALPDTELDAAVSPSLNRTPGSLKVLISSVHKRSGLLYSKARDFYGKPDPNTLVVMGTTLQFNPSYDAASIERDLERDPERYGAEYLCKWRDDLSSFIPHDLLTAATDNGVLFRHPTKATYTAACDAAGGRGSDSFTAAIAHKEPDGQVVLDRLFERKAPFDAASVIAEIAALLREYGINTITGDRFAGGFPYVDGPLLARLVWAVL